MEGVVKQLKEIDAGLEVLEHEKVLTVEAAQAALAGVEGLAFAKNLLFKVRTDEDRRRRDGVTGQMKSSSPARFRFLPTSRFRQRRSRPCHHLRSHLPNLTSPLPRVSSFDHHHHAPKQNETERNRYETKRV